MKTRASPWKTAVLTIVAASTILAAEPQGGASIPDVLYPRLGPAVEPVWVSRAAATGADGEFNWGSLSESSRHLLEHAVSVLWARERKERGEAAAPALPVEVMARQVPCIDVTAMYGRTAQAAETLDDLLTDVTEVIRGSIAAVEQGFYHKAPATLLALTNCRVASRDESTECPGYLRLAVYLPASFAIGSLQFCTQAGAFPVDTLAVGDEILAVSHGALFSVAEPEGLVIVMRLWSLDREGHLTHPNQAQVLKELGAARNLDDVETVIVQAFDRRRDSLHRSRGGDQ